MKSTYFILIQSKGDTVINTKVHESAEDYLETILILSKQKGNVRSIDIANEMAFSKPSVSIAMKNLRQNGHILVDGDGYITLTDSGLQIAETIYERHTVLTRWLVSLGVDLANASKDACRMEHDMSPQTFEAIKTFIHKTLAD